MNSLVIDNPNEFVEHVIYASRLLQGSDNSLRSYLSALSQNSDLNPHNSQMNYLKKYISIPAVKDLIEQTEKRVNEFISQKTIDSKLD